MPKVAPNDMLDASLDFVASSSQQFVCSTLDATPTRAEVVSAALSFTSMTTGDGNGDYTIADGDSSGRKVTVTAQSGLSVDTTGTASHIALVDDSVVRYVTTCTAQVVTSGNTLNIPAWKIELLDPS